MAYANLVNQTVANRNEAFQRLRDFVCKRNGTFDYSTTGIGWTLHDSSYATDEDNVANNDYCVLHSNGEDGKRDIYIQILLSTTVNYIKFTAYAYWDNITHTGVHPADSSSGFWCDTSSFPLYIYGDLDAILGISSNNAGSTSYTGFAGLLTDTVYPSNTETCISAVAASATAEFDVGVVPSNWNVGNRLVIQSQAGIENTSIDSKTSSTVTVATTLNHTANSKLSREHVVLVQNTFNFMSTMTTLITCSTRNTTVTNTSPYAVVLDVSDPSSTEGDYFAGPMCVYGGLLDGGFIGNYPNWILATGTNLTKHNVYTTADSVSYRYFIAYSGAYILVKEV